MIQLAGEQKRKTLRYLFEYLDDRWSWFGIKRVDNDALESYHINKAADAPLTPLEPIATMELEFSSQIPPRGVVTIYLTDNTILKLSIPEAIVYRVRDRFRDLTKPSMADIFFTEVDRALADMNEVPIDESSLEASPTQIEGSNE